MTIKEYHVTSRDRLVSVWIVLYGAIDRVILALLHSDRTPYGTRADIKGNGAFAGLDFAAAGATVSTATYDGQTSYSEKVSTQLRVECFADHRALQAVEQ